MSGWRLPLRVARRDARHAPGRSLLIILMITLPILGLTAADVIYRSGQLDTSERLSRVLGQTQASLTPQFGPVNETGDPTTPEPSATGAPATFKASIPGAQRVVSGDRILRTSMSSVYVTTPDGLTSTQLVSAETSDPVFHGRYRLEKGRSPASADEVAASPEMYKQLSGQLGQKVQFHGWVKPLTLVGVVAQVGQSRDAIFFTRPGTSSAGPPAVDETTAELNATYYVAGSRPVTWTQVGVLNRLGFSVESRYVTEHPPPASARPAASQLTTTARLLGLVVIILAVSLALLEVVLLAGAAFAVGARRQSRWLGLLVATGGDSRHVRRVVLGGGLILGFIGSILGVGLGLLLAALAIPQLQQHVGQDFGHFDIRPVELLGVAILGTLTGLLAAVLPARTASRQDAVTALSGRRGEIRTPRKVPAIGLVVVVLGIICAAVGSAGILARVSHAQGLTNGLAWLFGGLIAGGAILTQLGLIICSPALVGWAARLSTHTPLPFRLAMRDAGRHRGRSAPAVAAILTAAAGSTAALLIVGSFNARDRQEYVPRAPHGAVQVTLTASSQVPTMIGNVAVYPEVHLDPAKTLAAVGPTMPAGGGIVVRSMDGCVGFNCGGFNVDTPSSPETQCTSGVPPTDWRCRAHYEVTNVVIGGPESLDILAGHSSPAAIATLKAGGIVFVSRQYQDQHIATFSYNPPAPLNPAPAVLHGSAPAVYLAADQPSFMAIASPALASRLRLVPRDQYLLLRPDHLPSKHQQAAAAAAVAKLAPEAYTDLYVERGYQSSYLVGELAILVGAGIIMLGAAGIATGLAQADARADQATLMAIGATPRLRKTLAACQALAVAGLGALLGFLSGLVPALAFVEAVPSLKLAVPWLPVAGILIGLPLLAAIASWLFTRSQLAMDRRLAV
jgi:putative ABC transport system permease protein